MNFRKLRNWRLWLILTHRWLGIAVGIAFLIWCLSGIVLLYYGIPHLTAGERLTRLPTLDLSTAAISPAQAARQIDGEPFRLRVSMLGDRPVYRINTGNVFGRWTLVYADTGELMTGLGREAALAWVRETYPEKAASPSYEAHLDGPDLFTHSPAMQPHMPMHRIALNDAAGTKYYVSDRSGEAVMKTDTASRWLGLTGYMIHTLFFFRQQTWWSATLRWLSWTVLAMCILGFVLGLTRFGFNKRFRRRGAESRSPYSGLMLWHHYAGLIVGLASIGWMFSGLVSMSVIPGIRETLYSPEQIAAGARSVQGQGARTDFAPLSVTGMQTALAKLEREFPVKELELVYFNGDPYYLAYRSPTPTELANWESHSALDFLAPALEQEHRLIAATGTGTPFERFPESAMLEAGRRAMPSAHIVESEWLDEHDAYYYNSVASFDLGLPKTAKTLPVLRIKFDDPASTWLYLAPSHGQIVKAERSDRLNRWAYYGLHGFDFAALYERRPLWDITVIALLLGVGLVSATTLLPMARRLKRHAKRLSARITTLWADSGARAWRDP